MKLVFDHDRIEFVQYDALCMRVLFMGSDELACPSLRALFESPQNEVVGVVSQPDRPSGRKRKLAPCPLKAYAEGQGIKVIAPEKIGDPEAVDTIRLLEPDIIVLVAYGQYVPSRILEIPPHGAINLHPSLLPKYRGAAPIQMAIADGQTKTGVTILYVSKKMDAGDIILQESLPIEPADTAVTLAPKLAELGARLVLDAIDLHRKGEVRAVPQDESQATLVHKLTKEDGRIDWTMPAKQIRDRVRGFQPWPMCYCECPPGSGEMLRIHSVRVEEGGGRPAEVLDVAGDGPLIATGKDALRLLTVQPPGKSPMDGAAYLRGKALEVGSFLG